MYKSLLTSYGEVPNLTSASIQVLNLLLSATVSDNNLISENIEDTRHEHSNTFHWSLK